MEGELSFPLTIRDFSGPFAFHSASVRQHKLTQSQTPQALGCLRSRPQNTWDIASLDGHTPNDLSSPCSLPCDLSSLLHALPWFLVIFRVEEKLAGDIQT